MPALRLLGICSPHCTSALTPTRHADSVLEGLMTVFHIERSSDSLMNVQARRFELLESAAWAT